MNGFASRSPSIHLTLPPNNLNSSKRRSRGFKHQILHTAAFRHFLYNLRWQSKSILVLLVLSAVLIIVIRAKQPNPFFYPPKNVRDEVEELAPLSGCFDDRRISPTYNLTRARGPKYQDIQEGRPFAKGRDCYNLASTIQPRPEQEKPSERVNFHTYWRVDLVQFQEREEYFLKSFFATQDVDHSRLIIWSNGDLSREPLIAKWLRVYPDAFELRRLNVDLLARGTALEGSSLLYLEDTMAWIDGDAIRLLVLWVYGGVWIDLDFLFTRDISPLLEHEFLMRWDCHDRDYLIFNGAIMHFLQNSPYLCEAFHIMATSAPPRPRSTDWGAILYLKLYRRLIAHGIPPFRAIPWCFVDGSTCVPENNIPSPFYEPKKFRNHEMDSKEGGELDQTLQKMFAVHLHNQWDMGFPENGWVSRLLLQRYDRTLGLL